MHDQEVKYDILAIEGIAFPQTATVAREFTSFLKHLVAGCGTTVSVMVLRTYRTRCSHADIPYWPPFGLTPSVPALFAITDLVAAIAATASAAPRCPNCLDVAHQSGVCHLFPSILDKSGGGSGSPPPKRQRHDGKGGKGGKGGRPKPSNVPCNPWDTS
jgi:hypothetical protein